MCAVSGMFAYYPHPGGQGLAKPWSSTVYLGWFKLIMYKSVSCVPTLYKSLPKWSAVCQPHVNYEIKEFIIITMRSLSS